ncbi:DUF4199 domain-containing protein [Flavihumibacter rivuli]|uniref:DUF4199 domain-containing protein n=1 Tax=Flavihumibacter rivuli TaxID=2838156 RepID=UPI001BDDFFF1|nr:DUF4199 domain-containing protein [Flavihumibacter rivuli]ULQ57552.1 DUF4199 domain-containing protein [Flavihumibacter rivuli]
MPKKLSVWVGLSAGLLYTLCLFITWKVGIESMAAFLTWYAYLPVIFVLVLGVAWWYRYSSGAFLELKTVIQYALLAYFIYEMVYAVSNYVLYGLLDKDLNANLVETLFRQSETEMRAKGGENIEARIEEARKLAESAKKPLTLVQVLIGSGQNLILHFIKSVIIATIIKQTNPAAPQKAD